MIIGTAGHIDHGKTSLVRALTGVDTDRLPEEKRRGITIELGFAPLRFADGTHAGIVDVPGHEAFVRTMLAGATGVDVALLVIAADEGVMPQTREHLAILTLLDVRDGVIALAKSDLVDADWLALVIDDVRALLADTPFASSAVVAVSSVTGDGLDLLKHELRLALDRVVPRDPGDLFRMPVDRVFTVKGTGTVVTGTVWSGALAGDQTVRLFPGDRRARVRGIQRHGEPAERALPGQRCAVALAGVDVAEAERGGVIVDRDGWRATTRLIADVTLLGDAPAALSPRSRIRLHLGTVDVGARIIAAEGRLQPGRAAPARVVLDEPILARGGDRFVLRHPSPAVTIGGGVIVDPLPPRLRAKPWSATGMDRRDVLKRMVDDAGQTGVPVSDIPVRLGVAPGLVPGLIEQNGVSSLVRCGDVLVASSTLEALGRRLLELVGQHHRSAPLEPGVPLEAIRSQLGAGPAVDRAVSDATKRDAVVVAHGLVHLAGWQPTLAPKEHETLERLRGVLRSAGREPPAVSELVTDHGAVVPGLLRMLEREGAVVRVDEGRYYDATVLETLTTTLRQGMEPGKRYSPAELRELLGVSRKYLIPLLEFCDRRRITERQADGRVLAGV
jgi:selenocysteine-specific elongation factor